MKNGDGGKNMIELKHVSKKYKDKVALSEFSMEIPRGQIIGLFGNNGAGKTTFMKCIMGFLSFEGEITLDGKKIDGSNIFKLSFATGDHSFFPSVTADDHKWFYKMQFPLFNEKRYDALMEKFGRSAPATGFAIDVDGVAAALPEAEQKPAEKLVHYEIGQLAAAMALQQAAPEGAVELSCCATVEGSRALARKKGIAALVILTAGGMTEEAI